jgi:hypothetical protein
MKLNKCIFPFGSWLESLINVLSFGWGAEFAHFIAWKFFKTHDCGCQRRKDKLNKLFNCDDNITLNLKNK